MARTKSYTAQVKNAITYANKKIRDVEKLFGAESAQYQRYVNVVTAALPPGAYTISDTGRVRIKADKATVARVKKGEVRPVTKLPTASKSLNMAKANLSGGFPKNDGKRAISKTEYSPACPQGRKAP